MMKFFEYIKLLENDGKSHEGTVAEIIEFLKTMPPDAKATVTVDMPEADPDQMGQDQGEGDEEEGLGGKQDANGKFRRPLDNI